MSEMEVRPHGFATPELARQAQASGSSSLRWRHGGTHAKVPVHVAAPVGLVAGGNHLLVFDVLPGEGSGVVGQREPHQRTGAALGGAEGGRTQRSDDFPDSGFALGEASAHDAGVKAVGVQLRRAPGQLAGEQDVAQLRGAVHAWRVGLL